MQSLIKPSERRRHFRVPPSLSNPVLTTYRRNNESMKSLPVKDISLSGVAFYVPEMEGCVPVGTVLPNMQINLPNQGQINASGVVRRIEKDTKNDRVVCAMEFTRVPTSSDRKLYSYLNERQRELLWFSRN